MYKSEGKEDEAATYFYLIEESVEKNENLNDNIRQKIKREKKYLESEDARMSDFLKSLEKY